MLAGNILLPSYVSSFVIFPIFCKLAAWHHKKQQVLLVTTPREQKVSLKLSPQGFDRRTAYSMTWD